LGRYSHGYTECWQPLGEIAETDQGGLGLPDRDYYTKDDAKSEELRKAYVAHVQKIFELLGDKPEQASAEAATVLRRTAFSTIVRESNDFAVVLMDSQGNSLAENTILGVHYRQPAVTGPGLVFLDQKGIQHRTQQVIRDFDVRPPNPMLPARALSGGNQQKLIIGREFELPPKLLLVSQPTRGVDIGAIEFIHRKLVALRDAGCAVLLVSAELEEVTSLSDRLLVLHNGRIAGEVDPKTVTNEEIGLMMTGGRK